MSNQQHFHRNSTQARPRIGVNPHPKPQPVAEPEVAPAVEEPKPVAPEIAPAMKQAKAVKPVKAAKVEIIEEPQAEEPQAEPQAEEPAAE